MLHPRGIVAGVHLQTLHPRVTGGGPFPLDAKRKKVGSYQRWLTSYGITIILSDPRQTYSGILKAKRGHCEAIFDTIILILS